MMKTIKWEVVNALRNLSLIQLKHFCHQLLDRRVEPRITRREVIDKDAVDVADLLVSTFTEPVALTVTLETLRLINCNEEAKRLESETKICTDKGDPTFCRNSEGALETATSQEAQVHSAKLTLGATQPSRTIRKPEDVKAEAMARVQSEGGNCGNDRLVLSRFTIEFGKYEGKTFKWLLENVVGYTSQLVASHLEEQVDKNSQNPHMANKNALTDYSTFYPDFAKEVRFHRPVPEGKVGFHTYKSETLKSLYESTDTARIRYVKYLRSMKETCTPNSKMEVAIRYILQRDQKKPVAARRTTPAATRPSTSSATRPHTRREHVRHARGRARGASVRSPRNRW
ncbi:uncharacterized protein LOC143004444 [Genypterus blacodes]|uniref:uncharacterized protein LOC143004444 n=1 Tax=Genypterus blacodes TaxID=154954 RepID=UPI003F76AE5D